jgi:hypothetical protein
MMQNANVFGIILPPNAIAFGIGGHGRRAGASPRSLIMLMMNNIMDH